MTFEQIVEEISKQAGNIESLGAKLKFALGEQNVLIDGTGDSNVVSLADRETDADTVIITSLENFVKLKNGDLNPMMAVMGGKVKIKGDMGLAMKIQSLL